MRLSSTTVRQLAFFAIALQACFAGIATAEQPAPQQNINQSKVNENGVADGSPAEHNSLIERIHSPRSSDRRSATRELQKMGISGHPVLRRLAETGDADTAARAIDLLREASSSGNEALAESARESLHRIANQNGAGAKMAEDILNAADRPSRNLPPAVPPLQQLRQLQLNFAQPMRRQTRISIRSVNGVRSIEVTENNRQFKFRDTGNGLEVERPGVNGGVQRATYKDANELKKKDAEAYGHYQRAGGDKANGLGGMALPLLGNPQNRNGGIRPRIPAPNEMPLLNLPDVPKFRWKQPLKIPPVAPPPGQAPNLPETTKPQRIEV